MSTYAIGDIQGCFHSFKSLLAKIEFSSEHDQLWICGDLVNRGPDSLNTLRWIKHLNERDTPTAKVVLGNHDLHLLATYFNTPYISQSNFLNLERSLLKSLVSIVHPGVSSLG